MFFSRLLLLSLLLATLARAQAPGGDGTKAREDDRYPAAGAIENAASATKRLTVSPGLQVDLWASEPLLQNAVAFSFDEQGRAYVAETGRRRTSVPDIRKHMDWLLPDLALRSVEERAAFLRQANPSEPRHAPDKEHGDLNYDGRFDWQDLAIESETIRRVEDQDGDGTADHATDFATGFHDLATGVGAGVLARGGQVYYTCLPDVWRIPATGPAEGRTQLATGFGVHVAFGGHDLHGIKQGPDGRLYWSVADCGAHVVTKEGQTIDAPDMGAVYRSETDGSHLELYAWGLRNPQSLAFNDVGDLFTGDNNADGGDKARWEHVVEGADFGWRIGWQFLPQLGAWNLERLWELDAGRTALSQLPPVGHIGHGPAGIAYYPGTGLPATYREHFFYADFPGGVRSFALQPRGASYTVAGVAESLQNNKQAEMTGKVLWGLYPSDVQFGVEGGVYVLDWVEGWDKTGKGRIFRVHDPAVDASAEVRETKALLAQDLTARPETELLPRLGHADARVRLAAQFALASRGEAALPVLAGAAAAPERPRLARLHAIWALGQIGRQSARALAPLVALLREGESEVRAQAAKCAAECLQPPPASSLLPLLQDPEPRVRFFAAQALGRIKAREALPALLGLARENADSDPYLRHAVVVALAALEDVPALTAEIHQKSDSVRTVVLLALRRLHRPEVAEFLQDWNPQLVLEAARAVHDEPIPAALSSLASFPLTGAPAPLARRIVNAGFRLGTATAAETLAQLASDEQATLPVRLDALQALAQWKDPLGRDRVLGTWSPDLPGREAAASANAARSLAPKLLLSAHKEVQLAAIELIAAAKTVEAAPALLELLRNAKAEITLRTGALRTLQLLNAPQAEEALALATSAPEPALRAEARRLAARLSPAEALSQALASLEKGSLPEQQAALQMLASLHDKAADKALGKWMERLLAGKVPGALRLELLEAARQSQEEAIQSKLAAYEQSRNAADPLSRYAECLEGGDAQLGRTIFYEKAEVACFRCHKVKGEGGDVGPELAGVATKHDRAHILTSIAAPNAAIAPGFETVLLTMKDGSMVVGLASAETAEEYTLTPLTGGAKSTVKKANVKQRDKVPSVMPEGLAEALGPRDLRNVVEYLSTLK